MSAATKAFSQELDVEKSTTNQNVIPFSPWKNHKSKEIRSNKGESIHEEKSATECPYNKTVAEANQLIGKITLKELRGRFPAMYKDTYTSWRNAKHRAKKNNIPFSPDFDAFKDFLRLVGFRPCPSASLDRIDNAKGYDPANCRWASKEQQSLNRRCTVTLTYDGKTKPLVVWARERGERPDTLRKRRAKGWDDEGVITGKPRHPKQADRYPWPIEWHDRLESEYRRRSKVVGYDGEHPVRESRAEFYLGITGDLFERMYSAWIEAYDQGEDVPAADFAEKCRRARRAHLEAKRSCKESTNELR